MQRAKVQITKGEFKERIGVVDGYVYNAGTGYVAMVAILDRIVAIPIEQLKVLN